MSVSLDEAIQRAGGAVPLLRNRVGDPHFLNPLPVVPAEFTNWESEQRAWRESVALMDLSHHMTDLFLRGPGVPQLLSDLGVNSFANFTPGRAKQLVVCNPDGFYIGDGILFHLPDGSFNLVGWEMMTDWVQYHLETGDYDATYERDDSSVMRKEGPPRQFRYQIQGPQALAMMEEVLGHPVPPVKFFHIAELTIAGQQVHILRHGMAAQPGFEVFGPWAYGDEVREAILTAGKAFGLSEVGAKAYATANLESGWIPPTLPAVFSGEETLGFRKWVGTETLGSLGGSLFFEEIEDYYLTPFDLGYGNVVAFDHDFVGRKALEEVAKDPPRTRVTLIWDPEDVARVLSTHFDLTSEEPAKFINLPKARYGLYQKDEVRYDGRRVGVSMDCGLIANEKAMVSLATIDNAQSSPGTEVTVLWGEVPNSAKPHVEPHVQVEIRATVAPAPLPEFARRVYRDK